MSKLWLTPEGKLIVDANGRPIDCPECPCPSDDTIPTPCGPLQHTYYAHVDDLAAGCGYNGWEWTLTYAGTFVAGGITFGKWVDLSPQVCGEENFISYLLVNLSGFSPCVGTYFITKESVGVTPSPGPFNGIFTTPSFPVSGSYTGGVYDLTGSICGCASVPSGSGRTVTLSV